MPELPEVEITVRGLAPILTDARLETVLAFRPDLRRPFPRDLAQRLTGATCIRLYRRGKYGVMITHRGDAMIFHLGMSGRWRIEGEGIEGERIEAQPRQKHDHLLLATDSGWRCYLHDPRRFGSIDLVCGDPEDSYPTFRTMGPEPLSSHFTTDYLAKALAGRRTSIKALLLDQRIVAGLGNIYVCEALYRTHLRPTLVGGALDRKQIARLLRSIKHTLRQAITAGGSSLRDFLQPDGALGYFSNHCQVYGREGKLCTCCGAQIARITQNARSSFFCPHCQR